MKILQIRGSNLASLAGEFSLDFEDGPLAEAGLFAIAGPTGAGKSTLLDALCLALYDKTPRLDTVSTYQIPDVVEEVLGVNDPRNLLRRGTAEGFAEVRFIGSDDRRYRANWSVRRARKKAVGRLQNTEIEFIDEESNQPIGRTKGEVLAAIERAVGLTFEQFRRSILLAQGDFAAFLKAKGDERSELLERMTGTAFYSAISMRAHAKAREIEATLRLQEESASTLVLLDPEARFRLEQQLVDSRQQVETLTLQLADLRSHKAWWETHQTLRVKVTEAQRQQAEAEQQWNGAAARRQILANIEQAQPLRSLHVDATRTVAEHATKERKLSDATEAAASARVHAQDQAQALQVARASVDAHRATAERQKPDLQRAQSLDQSIADKSTAVNEAKIGLDGTRRKLSTLTQEGERLTAQYTSMSEELQQVQGWLESNAPQVILAQIWSEGILPQLQSFQRTFESWKLLSTAVPDLEAAHKRAASELAAAQQGCVSAEEATQSAAAQVREAETAESTHPANSLGKRRQAVSAMRERISSLQEVRQQAQAAQRALQDCREEIVATREDAERGRMQSVEAKAKLEEVLQQQQQNERLLLQLGLDAHRASLVEGDPCPLCGATHHPGVRTLHETAAELEAQKRRLVARVRELLAQQAGGEVLQDTSTVRIAELQTEVTRYERDLQAGTTQWRALEGQADPSDAVADVWISELLRQRDTEDTAITEQAAAFEHVRAAAVNARKARDQASENERQARRTVDSARAADASAKTQLDQSLARRDAHRQSLDGILSSLSPSFDTIEDWQVELEANPAEFIRRWNASVEEARQSVAARQRATTKLTEIECQQAVQATRLQAVCHSAEEQEQLWTRLGAEFESLRTERAPLLQGRSVSEAEQELASLQQQAASAHARAQNEEREATSAAAARDAALDAATQARDQSATARDGAAQRLDEALATVGVDHDTLQDRLARDETWISHERGELHAIDLRRSNQASVTEERTRELQSHEATPAPDQTLEAIAAELSQQEPRLAVINQQLGSQQTRLNHDNESRALSEQHARKLEEAHQQARIWQQLDTLIGSADGRKLRKFAQSLTMELLLAHANAELRTLAPRYELQRVKAQDLELQVIDHYMGDEVRSTSSLSGGETFLVSLSLALGLSSLASEKVRIESLFVDEGFGTLDPQTLEMALATLDSLQAAGRKVGLISHVPGLAERIGVQVLVERQGHGASTVRVIHGCG